MPIPISPIALFLIDVAMAEDICDGGVRFPPADSSDGGSIDMEFMEPAPSPSAENWYVDEELGG